MNRDMDLKHAMLYSELDTTLNRTTQAAAAAIGLPTMVHEPPPPSYDEAISPPHQPGVAAQPTAPELILSAPISSKAATSYGATDAITRADFDNSAAVMQDQSTQRQHRHQRRHHRQHHDQQQPQPSMPITVQPTSATVPHVAAMPHLGPHPCKVTCPACGQARTTRVNYTPNIRTHVSAMLLCLVGWCCCACIVPYCMNSCRTGNHYCAKCNTFLGAYTNAKRHF